ncbi:STAS domain-containing protein [Cellulomonas sp. S1-8]|uniref:STAS domain-containing protein n=1 Tax=Cellulomonas sp. S1-8 TaxID=2904790 RepID=UPI0022449B89|nr:STAS domain-containing protein [Cellulomonas sp. S1-8]UZN03918.1 STAS domain-containing protein [Cellulomonas sp. S1-8]
MRRRPRDAPGAGSASPAGDVVLGRGPRALLVLRGEVDAALVDDALLQRVAAAARGGLDVDVSGVTFLDARGLALLLMALGHLDGQLGRIVGPVPEPVRRVADAVGVRLGG